MVEGYLRTLVKYLKKNLTKGYTLDSLKWALVSQGYSRTEVERAIRLTNEELAKEAPKIKDKPVIEIEREPILQEIEPETKSFIKGFFKGLKDIFWS